MKIGVFATFMSPLGTPAMIQDLGRRVEAAGLDSLWMGEHVVLFDKTEFPYPGSRDGKLYCLDADGTELGAWNTYAPVVTSPAVTVTRRPRLVVPFTSKRISFAPKTQRRS